MFAPWIVQTAMPSGRLSLAAQDNSPSGALVNRQHLIVALASKFSGPAEQRVCLDVKVSN
jgi:hypothetical protein